jgi:hypothetical protein
LLNNSIINNTLSKQAIELAKAKIKKYTDRLLINRRYIVPKNYDIHVGSFVRVDLFTISNAKKDIQNPVKKQTFDPRWSQEIYQVTKLRAWTDKLEICNILINIRLWELNKTNSELPKTYQPNQILVIPSKIVDGIAIPGI